MSKNKRPVTTFVRKQSVIATGLALSLMAAHSVYAQQAAPVISYPPATRRPRRGAAVVVDSTDVDGPRVVSRQGRR